MFSECKLWLRSDVVGLLTLRSISEWYSRLVRKLCIELGDLIGTIVKVDLRLPGALLCRIMLPLHFIEAFSFVVYFGVDNLLHLPLQAGALELLMEYPLSGHTLWNRGVLQIFSVYGLRLV